MDLSFPIKRVLHCWYKMMEFRYAISDSHGVKNSNVEDENEKGENNDKEEEQREAQTH